MKRYITLAQTDFLVTFRDPVFKGLLFFPLIAFLLVRYLVPVLTEYYPVISPYTTVIVMWACTQTPVMFGFIYGFLFLEEKEEDVFQVLRVMPVSSSLIVRSRLGLGILFSFGTNMLILHLGEVVHLALSIEVLIAFQYSLIAPLLALVLGYFSSNRIQGLAQMKVYNLLIIVPALIFFIGHPALHILAVLPTYWSFRSLDVAVSGRGDFYAVYAIGLAFHILLLFFMNFRFKKIFF